MMNGKLHDTQRPSHSIVHAPPVEASAKVGPSQLDSDTSSGWIEQ
jgi:hypothetical protein